MFIPQSLAVCHVSTTYVSTNPFPPIHQLQLVPLEYKKKHHNKKVRAIRVGIHADLLPQKLARQWTKTTI